MNKLLLGCVSLFAWLAGPALAADPPIKRPVAKVPPPVALYDWSGFYVGGHVGWAWTDKTWADPTANARLVSDNGLGGVQGGYNWQTGAWVIGIEAQASWTHIRKGWVDPETDPVRYTKGGVTVGVARLGTTVENLGTVAARFGHAWDRALIYVKGGGAWAHDFYRATDEGTQTLLASARDTRWGWMAGIGYEYAFLGNWSAKVEFDYLWLGTKAITYVSVAGVTPPARTFDIGQDIALVKVGINYRFAPTPVIAQY